MSNGKGLALAGLILGLIGAGLGGYAFFNTTLAPIFGIGDTPSERNTYYVEEDSTFVGTTMIYTPLPGINVSFTTTQNMKLHVLFTCYVRISTSTGGESVYIHIYLNDLPINPIYYYIEAAGTENYERFAVNMQAFNNSLDPGTYNITVRAMVDDTLTRFYLSSLFVETYT